LEEFNMSRKVYRRNIGRLHRFSKRQNLPEIVRNRLYWYYQAQHPDGHHFDDHNILKELPPHLEVEVKEQFCAHLLSALRIDPGSFLSRILVRELVPRVFIRGTTIIRSGEPGRSMYFIVTGAAHVVADVDKPPSDANVLATLTKGHIFGELSLLYDQKPMTSVVVVDVLEAFELLLDGFRSICELDPAFRTKLQDSTKHPHSENVRADDSTHIRRITLWRSIETLEKAKVEKMGLKRRWAALLNVHQFARKLRVRRRLQLQIPSGARQTTPASL
jgi:CRP-like cAMP-binding protein